MALSTEELKKYERYGKRIITGLSIYEYGYERRDGGLFLASVAKFTLRNHRKRRELSE
jgi:hypothetical protein